MPPKAKNIWVAASDGDLDVVKVQTPDRHTFLFLSVEAERSILLDVDRVWYTSALQDYHLSKL